MFWSYLKTILRNISSSKVYFFINIASLTIGFTVFTLIMMFVLNELNYDKFNRKADRIYRVVEVQKPPGAPVQQVAITMPALGPALRGEFPEIENAVRFVKWTPVLCSAGNKRFYEDGVSFADPNFFKVFTFSFLEGSASKAFDGPNSIVIDQTVAKKYFGSANPIGRVINIDAELTHKSFVVTGLIRDFPRNSHLHFDMIAPFSVLEGSYKYFNGWSSNDVVTYVLLKPGSSSQELEKGFSGFLKSNLPEGVWSGLRLYLQPLGRIHLHSNQILYQINNNKGSIGRVRMFMLVALFVLLLAYINFVNLTTSRSVIRTREVGIRKLLGSYYSQVVYQFIGESVFLSLIALAISLPIVQALTPTFNSMMAGRIIIDYNDHIPFILALVFVAMVVGFSAGIYPAFYLSSFRPADLLKGRFSSSRRGILLRKTLITLQFGIAIGLVTGTAIVIDQMNYIYNKPLGFNKNNLICVPLRDAQSKSKVGLLAERLLADPRIIAVSAGERTGAGGTRGTVIIPGDGNRRLITVRRSYVDYNYVKTMGMTMLQGRGFSKDFPSDSSGVIINETMMNTLGWKDAVGKHVQVMSGNVFSVIGVVKDFNYFSLQNRIDPLVMWLRPDGCEYLVARIAPQDVRTTVGYVGKTWSSLVPDQPFEYGFLSRYLNSEYGDEANNEHLMALFSLVALVIACLGLFGLTLYTSEQRTKEIGVRKVLGASIMSIVMMLSKESIKLVIIAGAVAWPTAYYVMSMWLHNFAYRTTINAWVFVAPGFLVLLTAMFTLSFQAIKAGVSNPVDTLRYE